MLAKWHAADEASDNVLAPALVAAASSPWSIYASFALLEQRRVWARIARRRLRTLSAPSRPPRAAEDLEAER